MTPVLETADFLPDEAPGTPAEAPSNIIAFPHAEMARRRLAQACDDFRAPEAELRQARLKLDGRLSDLDRSVQRLDDARRALHREAARARAIAADAERLEQALLGGVEFFTQ